MRVFLAIYMVLLCTINLVYSQEPITFFKDAKVDSLLLINENYSISNPVELSDRYVILAGFGGLGPSNPQVVGAIYNKEGDLHAVKNIKPVGNFDIGIGTFKKWGNDSLIACGRAYTSFNDWQGAATYMFDKDLNLLWQLPADSAFFDLSPINDSIAVGYCPYTTPLFSNWPYIGFVNYKTGKIQSLKPLMELQGYPFGLDDSTMNIDFCKMSNETIWLRLSNNYNGYNRSVVRYSIVDSSTSYLTGFPSITLWSAFKDFVIFSGRLSNPNYYTDVASMRGFGDTAFSYTIPNISDSTTFTIISSVYYQNKIHVFSTQKYSSTTIGQITQLSPTGDLLHRIELTDLATDTTHIYEPKEMIPTSDGGYLFIINNKGIQAGYIMKMDSTFHVRNSDVGVYIGVQEPLMADKSNRISLFPNPTTSHFTIQSRSAIISLTVYNLQGQQVLQKSNLNANSFTVEEQLPSGVYVVKVETEEGVEVRKVLVGSDNGQ